MLVARERGPGSTPKPPTSRARYGIRHRRAGADLGTGPRCRGGDGSTSPTTSSPSTSWSTTQVSGWATTSCIRAMADEEQGDCIRVMVRAPMRITKAALPGMRRAQSRHHHHPSSSIAASSTTARTVRRKRGRAIQRDALAATRRPRCPGNGSVPRPRAHRVHERGDVESDRAPKWMWLDVERVNDECLDDLGRGKIVSIPSRRYKVIRSRGRLVPAPATLVTVPQRPRRPRSRTAKPHAVAPPKGRRLSRGDRKLDVVAPNVGSAPYRPRRIAATKSRPRPSCTGGNVFELRPRGRLLRRPATHHPRRPAAPLSAP